MAWTRFSVFNLSNFPTSKTLQTIVRKSFSHYIFFWAWNQTTQKDFYICFSKAFFNFTSRRTYVEESASSWTTVGPITLHPDRFDRIYSIQCNEFSGDIVQKRNPRLKQFSQIDISLDLTMILDKNAFLNTDECFFCLRIWLDIVINISTNILRNQI